MLNKEYQVDSQIIKIKRKYNYNPYLNAQNL